MVKYARRAADWERHELLRIVRHALFDRSLPVSRPRTILRVRELRLRHGPVLIPQRDVSFFVFLDFCALSSHSVTRVFLASPRGPARDMCLTAFFFTGS